MRTMYLLCIAMGRKIFYMEVFLTWFGICLQLLLGSLTLFFWGGGIMLRF